MIQFVGAGPGAEDLITVRGAKLLEQADVVVYAGSLVNPAHLARTKQGCQIYDSASMTLEQVMDVMIPAAQAGKLVVRLHTGDPSIYGAIREQMDVLDEQGIAYDVCPGVSSFCGAAAALHAEYTLPDVSQTVILSRMAGRTPGPERESIRKLAAHGSTMVLFLPLLSRLESASAMTTASSAPVKAEIVTAAAPDRNRIPAAAPALAPEDTPMMSGDASGLRNTV